MLAKRPMVAFGIFFLAVSCAGSHMFYSHNIFKLGVLLLSVILLYLGDFFFFHSEKLKKKSENFLSRGMPFFNVLLIGLFPILGTLCGAIWRPEYFSFYSWIEITTSIVCTLWLCLLYKNGKTLEDWNILWKWIGLSIVIATIWGLMEYFGLQPQNFNGGGGGRIKSSFGNSNFFAGFLVVLLPFFLQLILFYKKVEQKGVRKDFLLGVLCMGFVGLFLTGTRAAWIAIFISCSFLFLFWLIKYKNFSVKKVLGTFFLLFLGLTSFLVWKGQTSKKERSIFELTTSKGWAPRINIYKAAFSSILKSPFAGHGPGSSYQLFFENRRSDYRLYSQDGKHAKHAHSEILETFQEGGVLGFISKLIFWSLTFLTLWKAYKSKRYRIYAVALFASFLGYLIYSTFSTAPRMIGVKMPLMTLLAFTFCFTEKRRPFRQEREALIFVFPLLLVSIWGASKFFPSYYQQMVFLQNVKKPRDLVPFEKKIEVINNPNFLHAISDYQITWKRWEQLERTIAQIEKSIGSWIHLDLLKALSFYKKGNFKKAKELALYYQKEKSNFDLLVQRLLFELSYKLEDFGLFEHELKLFISQQLVLRSFSPRRSLDSVRFIETKEQVFLNLKESKEELQVYWNKGVWKDIFLQGKYDPGHEKQVMEDLVSTLKKGPFFNLRSIKKIKERGTFLKVQKFASFYFKELRKKEIFEKRLEDQKKVELKMLKETLSGNISFYKKYRVNTFEKKYSRKMVELKSRFRNKVSSWESFLRENMYWEEFKKRIFFQKAFVKQFYKFVFQHRKS